MNSIKEQMVQRLKDDCKTLVDVKIPTALKTITNEKGISTYRNLTKALADNVKLIEEYDWKLMYSEYETDGKKQVSVWEQNGDKEIRNHKIWNVQQEDNKLYNQTLPNDRMLFFNEYQKKFLYEYSQDFMDKKYHKAIFYTTESTRSIGKTSFLLDMARRYDGIYVGSKIVCQEATKQGIKTAYNINHLRGNKSPIFIDERIVSKENIAMLDEWFKEYFAFVLVK